MFRLWCSLSSIHIIEVSSYLLSNSSGIISSFEKLTIDYDDPKFYYYNANYRTPNSRQEYLFASYDFRYAGGCSAHEETAIAKTLGEAVERHSAEIIPFQRLIKNDYNNLKNKAINPSKLILYSDNQYLNKGFNLSKFSNKMELYWIDGISLINKNDLYVPACFVFLDSKLSNANPINMPTSTGLACADTEEQVILKGIYESVERDAFTIMWLNKLPMPKIQLSNLDEESQSLIEELSNYGIEVCINYITNDIQIPVFLTILYDTTNNPHRPAVALGAGTNLDKEKALKNSLEEAALTWIATKRLLKIKGTNYSKSLFPNEQIESADDHVLLYSKHEMKYALDFLYNAPSISYSDIKSQSDDCHIILNKCLNLLKENLLEVCYVDITPPYIDELGLKVGKILIPELVPFQFTNIYQCLNANRIYQVPIKIGMRSTVKCKLNIMPHPFP